jgi:hypothetical protein
MEAARGSKRFWFLELYNIIEKLLYGNNNKVDITMLTRLREHLETNAEELPGIITPAERDYFRQLEIAAIEAAAATEPEDLKEKISVLWVAYHAAPADPMDNEILIQVLGDRDTKGITFNKLPPDGQGGLGKAREN